MDDDIEELFRTTRYASGTTRGVDTVQARFAAWCEPRELSALPATPATLGAYLAWMAAGATDATGEQVRAPYALSSIRSAKTAIGIAHHRTDLPSPAADPWVCLVMAGIARAPWLRRAQSVSPLGLTEMRAAMSSPPPASELTSLRDRAFLLTAAATRWPIQDVLALRRDSLDTQEGRVTVVSASGDAVELPSAASTALQELQEALPGRVRLAFGVRGSDSAPQFLTGTSRAEVTGLIATVRQALAKSASIRFGVRRPLPELTPAELERAVLARDRRRVRWLRDRALLLVAWHLALRGSEVGSIHTDDLGRDDRGYTAWLGRTKNDQLATGTPLSLLPTRDPLLEPVAALDRWLAYRLPAGPGALFCRLDGAQCRPSRGVTAGDDVLDIVKAWTAAAGLAGRFGAHSPRVGFVVTAIRAGASVAEIMTVTRQRSPEMVGHYGRAQIAAGRRAPKLLLQRARQASQ